ncbi:ribbon-helix-helix protein, CopG family [Mycobacterium hubeiense]|uniref:ribbon-helix-helix protein, CopG family n=1 Tax=Mycobacterium hubeiense TaxID=1867256 RepID=UPI000C7E9563|nr:ribbon-helix-helix protein, CopG family [Mycobacterium sp. QGD 101]
MVSFRADDEDIRQADAWARRLHIDRSELLRDALRHRLAALAADQEVQGYAEHPLTDDETALAQIADWGPAEDWADWADAAR